MYAVIMPQNIKMYFIFFFLGPLVSAVAAVCVRCFRKFSTNMFFFSVMWTSSWKEV